METLEQAVLDLRLSEQALMREAMEARSARIAELESEIMYLRRTLNEVLSAPRAAAAPTSVPSRSRPATVPRRWVA